MRLCKRRGFEGVMSSAAIRLLLEGRQCHSRWVADVIKYTEDQLLVGLRAKSGFWDVDWWRGVGCTMWSKARKARKEVFVNIFSWQLFCYRLEFKRGGKSHARKRKLAFEV
jgi:hypothetical protein